MLYVLTSFFTFGVAIAMHIAWCRYRPRKNLQIVPLVFFEMAGLLGYGAILGTFFSSIKNHPAGLWNVPLGTSSAVLYILLMPIYFAFYFNTRVESPTQRILRFIGERGQVTYNDLTKCICDNEIIIPRLDDLVRSGYVSFKGGAYHLAARGIAVAKVLSVYQVLIGREMGG